MLVDLDQRLCFPVEIATTSLRPDLVLWSSSLRSAFIVELTVPWEDAVMEAYEQKSLKYSELAADAEKHGWKTKVYPVEVGCRGFVGSGDPRSSFAASRQLPLQLRREIQPLALREETTLRLRSSSSTTR